MSISDPTVRAHMLYSAKADKAHGHVVYRNRLTGETRKITNIGDVDRYLWDDKVDLGPMDRDVWLHQASEWRDREFGPGLWGSWMDRGPRAFRGRKEAEQEDAS